MQSLFNMTQLICCPCVFNNPSPNWIKVYRLCFSDYFCSRKASILFQSSTVCWFVSLFPCWVVLFCHKQNTFLQRRSRLCQSPSAEIKKQPNVVITINPKQTAESFIPGFVLMSKHNTTHVNCCDPSNPPKGTLTYCLSSVRHCIIYTH